MNLTILRRSRQRWFEAAAAASAAPGLLDRTETLKWGGDYNNSDPLDQGTPLASVIANHVVVEG